MKCAQVQQWLRRDLDGAAEPSGDVAAHLERCDACRAEAERWKAFAAAARAALPRSDVPVDFTEQVMGALVAPSADHALAEAARPRMQRWLPVLAALLVVGLLPFLLDGAAAVKGDLRVVRGGVWVGAREAQTGELFGLEPWARAATARGVEVMALTPALLRAEPLELLGGTVHIQAADEPAVVRTGLGEIRLQESSACLAAMGNTKEEKEMSFDQLRKITPAVLAVTLLSGGATVANAQGNDQEVEKERPVRIVYDDRLLDEKELQNQLEQVRELIERARVALDSVPAADPVMAVDIHADFRKAVEAVERATRELKELKAQMKKRPKRKPVKQRKRRPPGDPAVADEVPLEEIVEEPVEIEAPVPAAVDILEEPGLAPPRARRASLEQLLARARRGDKKARVQLKKMMAQIQDALADPRRPLARGLEVDESDPAVIRERATRAQDRLTDEVFAESKRRDDRNTRQTRLAAQINRLETQLASYRKTFDKLAKDGRLSAAELNYLQDLRKKLDAEIAELQKKLGVRRRGVR